MIDDGPSLAKRLHKEKNELALHGPKLVAGNHTGMNFDGLIHQYKVKPKFRNKITIDELFFELVKMFKVEDSRIDIPFVTNLQESGLLTVSVPKSAEPKTKGMSFSCYMLSASITSRYTQP